MGAFANDLQEDLNLVIPKLGDGVDQDRKAFEFNQATDADKPQSVTGHVWTGLGK